MLNKPDNNIPLKLLMILVSVVALGFTYYLLANLNLSEGLDDKKATITSASQNHGDRRDLKSEKFKQSELELGADNGLSNQTTSLTLPQMVVRLINAGKFKEAEAMAYTEPDSAARLRLFSEIGRQWAIVDQTAAFLWASSIRTMDEKSCGLKSVVGVIASNDALTCLSLIGKMEKGKFKDIAFMAMAPIVAEGNYTELLKGVPDLTNEGSINSIARLISGILVSKNEIQELDRIIDGLPYGLFRENLEAQVVFAMSINKPQLALERLNDSVARMPVEFGLKAVSTIAKGYAEFDPKEGIAAGETISDISLRKRFFDELGGNLGEKNPLLAKSWLLSAIHDTDYQSNKHIADGIITGLVFNDHKEAMAFVDSIPDLESKHSARLTAVAAISAEDPESAARYLSADQNLDEVGPQTLITNIAQNWLERDPLAASQWIGNLKPGIGRDGSVAKLVENLLNKGGDRQLAKNWANQIVDTNLKLNIQKQLEIKTD